MLAPLQPADLRVDTVSLAAELIGVVLVREHPRGRISGRIVETEAYPVGDAASHAFRRKTDRNSSMFLRRGHAYVYFTYGSCYALNVSSETEGIGAAALIRAVEPMEGIPLMQEFRGMIKLIDLTRGPGRLAEAFDIDLRQNGFDLCVAGPLW